MVKALVDDGSFHINKVVKKWGYVDDKSKKDGLLYSSKAPLMSMFGAAAYGVYRVFGDSMGESELTVFCRFWANTLPVILLLLLLGWYLKRYFDNESAAAFAVVSLVTGTHLLAYTHIFSGHTIAALCAALMMLNLLYQSPQKHLFWHSVVVGSSATLAVGTEYPAFLAVVPLGLGFLIQRRSDLKTALLGGLCGALPFAGIAGYAHHAMFGNFWTTGYSYLENKSYNKLHSQDFFGIGTPHLDVLQNVLISTEVGLIFFSPLVILGAWGLVVSWRNSQRRLAALFVSLALLGMFLFIAGHRGWRGGWVVGPRYISEVTALLIILGVGWLNDKKAFSQPGHPWLHVAIALSVLGVIHSGIASAFFPHLSETYKNPVYEMMVPMALRGFSPDTWLLHWGISAHLSAMTGLCLLFLPLLIWIHGYSATAKTKALFVLFVTLSVALWAGPKLPGSKAATVGLETRHLYRNWSPAAGRPFQFSGDDKDFKAQSLIEPTPKTFKAINRMCKQKGEPK